jgi:hypothetical protein
MKYKLTPIKELTIKPLTYHKRSKGNRIPCVGEISTGYLAICEKNAKIPRRQEENSNLYLDVDKHKK